MQPCATLSKIRQPRRFFKTTPHFNIGPIRFHIMWDAIVALLDETDRLITISFGVICVPAKAPELPHLNCSHDFIKGATSGPFCHELEILRNTLSQLWFRYSPLGRDHLFKDLLSRSDAHVPINPITGVSHYSYEEHFPPTPRTVTITTSGGLNYSVQWSQRAKDHIERKIYAGFDYLRCDHKVWLSLTLTTGDLL